MTVNDKNAIVKMEEGYMRLSIAYTNPDSRSIICDTIGVVEKELDVYPEVFHKRKDDYGTFSIEFTGDTYICSRTSGEFVESVLKKLDITECDHE